MTSVRVENLTTHEGTLSNNIGYFEIEAKENDYLVFQKFPKILQKKLKELLTKNLQNGEVLKTTMQK